MISRVFITGATGFVGSRLAARLVNDNKEKNEKIEVHVTARPLSNLWRLKNIQEGLIFHEMDFNNPQKIDGIIHNSKPDIVFHLACYGGFSDETDPLKIIQTNFIGTQLLLDACVKNQIKKFIYIGSSSEYGYQSQPMREDFREEPYNLYGITKLAGSHLVRCYAKETLLPTTIFRIFSAYGIFEDPKRLIPSVINACLKEQPLTLGSGNQRRDFIYVEDIIDALMLSISQSPGEGEILNLGNGHQYCVREVVNTILSLGEYSIKPEWNALSDRKNEPASWVADITKTAKMLNWQPKTSLREGLAETIQWAKTRHIEHESI